VTPSNQISSWGGHTSEQTQIHRRLLQVGVEILLSHSLQSYDGNEAVLACSYSGTPRRIAAAALVSVTLRASEDALFRELQQRVRTGADSVPKTLTRIGDCEAPAIIAGAVFAGHRYARELDTEIDPDNRIRYDRVFYEGN
jgi:dimethylamine/trimethylamine dehydrogenase